MSNESAMTGSTAATSGVWRHAAPSSTPGFTCRTAYPTNPQGAEVMLEHWEAGTSEPLKMVGRVAWCTALFGAYQIGVKFVNVDGERARYLDMFVGFLYGTLGPGDVFSGEDSSHGIADPDDPFAA